MIAITKRPLQLLLIGLGRLVSALLFDLHVEGADNLHDAERRPLILIANHFSWFDAPLLALHLPFQPAFLVATESFRNRFFGTLMLFFDCIPIWRGQVDRQALRNALQSLEQGKVVGIFPEGGMNPANAARVARGERIMEVHENASRRSATLAPARPGSALLAVNSHAYVLPVAVLGSEHIQDNLPRWRRTAITIPHRPRVWSARHRPWLARTGTSRPTRSVDARHDDAPGTAISPGKARSLCRSARTHRHNEVLTRIIEPVSQCPPI